MKILKMITPEQVEKWSFMIIGMQNRGEYKKIKKLWEEIEKIQSEMDINNPNELEAITNVFNETTIKHLNGLA